MIKQDYSFELAGRLMGISPSFNTGGSAYERSAVSTSAFNEVLSTASRSGMGSPAAVKKGTEIGAVRDSAVEQRRTIKSFREAREVNKQQEPACVSLPSDKACRSKGDMDEAESSKSDKASSTQQADMALEGLAHILGLQPSELKEILESINIQPQDLIDQSKAAMISDRLSVLVGLDVSQSQALRQIISVLGNALSEAYADQDSAGYTFEQQGGLISNDSGKLSKSRQAGSADSPQIVVVEDNKPAIDILQAMAKLKVNLEELSRKLQNNPAAFAAEVSEDIKSMAADNSVSLNAEEAVMQEDENSDVYGMKQISSQESEGKSLRKDARGDTGTRGNGDEVSLNASPEMNTQVDSESSLQFASMVENQPSQSVKASEAVKEARQSSVSRNDILDQVVNKARVIISGEKSEMIMDLKPDSLGKLSLKIVTERGMVVAKFIAESQQVKEAIEANMQTLKDSLEKQGLSVQGFSVSVRQDAHKGFYREDRYNAKSGEAGARLGRVDGITEDEAALLEGISSANPYAWGDSSINLTA
ncbi:flagellar hook-length control protein FliK [Anaerobacterium chartisolvens]|uniref:Flagellar hook-length control protein FliK n=1 Tax=Anaerobacterium chartisolvens TaxID=1297424 RepID=A0A369B4R6_9FIRM|nr:flagellar hook-length control protein FliK [Anaerobacterium chartisolvens]RCX15516.1 flagellar hook-length control protein FliK [Anaerobacterium chartisolvens]